MTTVQSYPSCCVCGARMGHDHHGDCPVPDRRQPLRIIGHDPQRRPAGTEGRMSLGEALRRVPG